MPYYVQQLTNVDRFSETRHFGIFTSDWELNFSILPLQSTSNPIVCNQQNSTFAHCLAEFLRLRVKSEAKQVHGNQILRGEISLVNLTTSFDVEQQWNCNPGPVIRTVNFTEAELTDQQMEVLQLMMLATGSSSVNTTSQFPWPAVRRILKQAFYVSV